MGSNRRSFIRTSGMFFTGIASSSFLEKNLALGPGQGVKRNNHHFNMCGYAAPKLETVRIGYIGLGNRGSLAILRMIHIEGAEIKALCDVRTEKVMAANQALKEKNASYQPVLYSGNPTDWKKLCERSDIDLVYIATPWALHTPMAVYAMKHGKHVCVEVPAAKTLDECWQLVETSEATKKHCIILENCCYDYFELLTQNMARNGLFGEIIHGEGAYIHTLLEDLFSKEKYFSFWRLKENFRNGNLYPTHGLGPIAQTMGINRGDKMEMMVSVASNDFQTAAMASELAANNPDYKPFVGKSFRGNINTSIIKTAKGKTIMLQHDITSPNVYSRIHKLSGTKGSCLKYPLPGKIAFGHKDWITNEEFADLEIKYKPAIYKIVGELAKQIGGHGGMDFLMDWRIIDCLRNGLPVDMDVYDAALWSAIAPLSEDSIANHFNSVRVPDFTSGNWKNNKPTDISLSHIAS